jgi:hypothetical protein
LYNAFHNPNNNAEQLGELRELQRQINDAVFRAYGWSDVDAATDFHAVGYLPDGKNIRFTVSEESRVEVLRRLSKLNKVRFDERAMSRSSTKSVRPLNAAIEDGTSEDNLFGIG